MQGEKPVQKGVVVQIQGDIVAVVVDLDVFFSRADANTRHYAPPPSVKVRVSGLNVPLTPLPRQLMV